MGLTVCAYFNFHIYCIRNEVLILKLMKIMLQWNLHCPIAPLCERCINRTAHLLLEHYMYLNMHNGIVFIYNYYRLLHMYRTKFVKFDIWYSIKLTLYAVQMYLPSVEKLWAHSSENSKQIWKNKEILK